MPKPSGDSPALLPRTVVPFDAMGSFEAQRGRFGAFTDVTYMDVGDGIEDSASLGRGASLRALSAPRTTLDVFAGARRLDVESDLSVALNVGPQLSATAARDAWDGIG